MKKTFLLVPLAIILVMSLFLVSCEDEPELKIYKVTFLKDKGDTTPYDEKIVLEGSGITEAPKKPTKEGYDFEYWKPVDGESKYDLNTPVKSDLTLVASWKIKEFTVSFMDGETTAADPQTVEYGKTATAPTAPTKEGHTFSCWKKVGSSSPFDFETEVITEDTVLETVWDINTYTVTFKNLDDTDYVTKDVLYNGKVESPKAPEHSEKKYEFLHWTADAESKEEFKFDTTPIEDNLTLYPVFGIKKFTVTFVGAEGLSSVPEQQIVGYGNKAEDPKAKAKDGYVLNGWTKDEGEDTPFVFTSSSIESDIKLYPIIKKVLTLNFYDGDIIKYSSKVESGSTFVYPDNPTKEGYDFAGWKKKGEEEVYIYSSTVIGSDMELEACWNKKGLLSITNTGNVSGNATYKNDSNVTVIIIPEKINGVTTTKIADYAFNQWTNITKVVLPPTINSIGKNAFTGCTNLSQCTLSDNITTIGYEAFYGCSNLSVNIPNRISSIDSFAFRESKILEAILPETLMTMGNGVFYDCESLTTAVVPSTITMIPMNTFNGCNILKGVTINGNITKIGAYAFKYSGIYAKYITLNLPASIVAENFSIDVDAFFGRYTTLTINQKQSLSKLTIPDNKWGAKSLTINWLPE